MEKQLIENTKAYIIDLFRNDSSGHDADHSLRVYQNALQIAGKEGYAGTERVALAALLHDADDHKLFRTENNQNARDFLEKQGIDADEIDVICKIINGVSFSKNKDKRPEDIETKIVQDADRLDAIGAVGIARTFAFGGEKGRNLDSSIQHFHEKLLLLKDLMNTDAAKAIAGERHQFMVDFLTQYDKELHGIG